MPWTELGRKCSTAMISRHTAQVRLINLLFCWIHFRQTLPLLVIPDRARDIFDITHSCWSNQSSMAVRKMRNIRPRAEEDFSDSEVDEDTGEEMVGEQDDNEDDEESPSEAENGEDDDAAVEAKLSNVSFGALRHAQESLSRKRKRGSDTTPNQDDKLEALRARLRQIKEEKAVATSRPPSKSKRSSVSRQAASDHDGDDSSDSDSAPSEEDAPTKSRTSKHAPGAQSTRHQVTRKRVVVDVPKRVVRDPRFDALRQHSVPNGNSEKAYSFLRDYQKAEMDELRAAIKRTKNEDDKDILRRKLGSMDNKLKAKDAKDREQEILRRHRKEEREKIQQGKTPFYLKQKDIKEQALVEKFKGMKSKDREKLIEKRRKKEGQKEKKRMPDARRMAG